MSRDTFVLIAFCVFMLLAGMRLKQRFGNKKKAEEAAKINKNQRPKMAEEEEPPLVKEKRLGREKRVRLFTMIQLVVLFGLMVFMTPSLVKDFMLPGQVDALNLFLRCLIFVFTIYIFILGYLKVFGRKREGTKE